MPFQRKLNQRSHTKTMCSKMCSVILAVNFANWCLFADPCHIFDRNSKMRRECAWPMFYFCFWIFVFEFFQHWETLHDNKFHEQHVWFIWSTWCAWKYGEVTLQLWHRPLNVLAKAPLNQLVINTTKTIFQKCPYHGGRNRKKKFWDGMRPILVVCCENIFTCAYAC